MAAGLEAKDFATLLRKLPQLQVPRASSSVVGAHVVVVGGSVGGLAVASCLRAAGFSNLEVVERSMEEQMGAGVGLDDATVGILKGLGVFENSSLETVLMPMRWTEERSASGHVILRQAYPYFSTLYSELRRSLAATLPQDIVSYGRRVIKVEHMQNGRMLVQFEEGPNLECDIVIAADGPRSPLRKMLSDSSSMRFAGYAAWRGVVREDSLTPDIRQTLRKTFPLLGNCLYFIQSSEPRQHSVLYEIGPGLFNWLIYENCSAPVAEPGRTTSAARLSDVARLHDDAQAHWGEALGSLIQATPDPFWTDVYDMQVPLATFSSGPLALLGDAAHAITPHMAKGSNLAIHDAFVLACAAASAKDVPMMLQAYSDDRASECARTSLLSRHLGRLRNGMTLESESVPVDGADFVELVRNLGLPTSTLPCGNVRFEAIWEFAREMLPSEHVSFFLDRQYPSNLSIVAVNHISRKTSDVERLSLFYGDVLGLRQIQRPDFGFGGAWFQLPNGIQLHIIESDQAKWNHVAAQSQPTQNEKKWFPERCIRRSHHIALTVDDIEVTKLSLIHKGIPFVENVVPDTSVVQLFLYDPDGNGIEIGNFNRVAKL